MLSYAFQRLQENGYKHIGTEEFENAADLCAAILVNGLSIQIKQGLIYTSRRSYLLSEVQYVSIRNPYLLFERVIWSDVHLTNSRKTTL